MTEINLVICDDHPLFADALARVLEAHRWSIRTVVSTPAHAVAAVANGDVDTCLMDLTFPEGDIGLDGISSVRETSPTTKVVVLTASRDPKLIQRALESGAEAVAFKDDNIDTVIDVVERLHEPGRRTLRRGGERRSSMAPTQARDHDELARFLTDREFEVLGRLVHGESGKQIALAMGITYSTVRTHIQNILAKLGVHTRLAAVAFAMEHELFAARPA
jgi:two-component system nitrate/nitrite response regulator NarL